MRKRHLIWLLLLSVGAVFGGAGCLAAVQSHQAYARNNLLETASVQLACPAGQLSLAPGEPMYNGWAHRYVVTGCGRRAAYVQVPIHYTGHWYNEANAGAIAAARRDAAARAVAAQAGAHHAAVAGAIHHQTVVNHAIGY
jgi:uncharacterized protein YpmB